MISWKIIFIVYYGLCAWASYEYVRRAHSKGGRWARINPGLGDAFLCFIPFLNTIQALMFISGAYKDEFHLDNEWGKFFRVHK